VGPYAWRPSLGLALGFALDTSPPGPKVSGGPEGPAGTSATAGLLFILQCQRSRPLGTPHLPHDDLREMAVRVRPSAAGSRETRSNRPRARYPRDNTHGHPMVTPECGIRGAMLSWFVIVMKSLGRNPQGGAGYSFLRQQGTPRPSNIVSPNFSPSDLFTITHQWIKPQVRLVHNPLMGPLSWSP